MVVVIATLFVVNGFVLGWVEAYEILVTIGSPADTSHRAVAWMLSVAGWLAQPVTAAAIIALIVSKATRTHDDC
ncbi:MAG TPA: hypothetical protein VFR11_22815 [Micromonosporaceae bacterium]|jgi:hypothetical protein|nr:hypothetical protein [Micromonosporaceae bacterium]